MIRETPDLPRVSGFPRLPRISWQTHMKRILLLTAASAALLLAQPYPTHVAMDKLLSIRYFANQGNFMLAESVPVLFPPPGETKAKIVIKKAAGGVALSKDMIIEPWPPHEGVFGNLKAADGQMGFGPIAPGDYMFAVEMKGKEISSYKFSVTANKGGDPFAPTNDLARSGPWSKWAFIVGPANDTGHNAGLGIWMSTRDMPGYQPNKQTPYSIHLMNGAKQVGLIEGRVTDPNWEFFWLEFSTSHGGGPLKWAALNNAPGAYTMELRANGQVVRRYKFQVTGGKIARIPANEVNYEGPDALPAQSLRGDTRYQEFWMEAVK